MNKSQAIIHEATWLTRTQNMSFREAMRTSHARAENSSFQAPSDWHPEESRYPTTEPVISPTKPKK